MFVYIDMCSSRRKLACGKYLNIFVDNIFFVAIVNILNVLPLNKISIIKSNLKIIDANGKVFAYGLTKLMSHDVR